MIHSSALVRLLLGLSLFIGLSGCSKRAAWQAPASAKALHNPVPVSPETLALGRMLYLDNCARCHRDDGTGRRPPLSMLSTSVPPANFTDVKVMNAMTDGEIFWKITEGRRPMPGFKSKLTDQQRWELVNFIRLFSQPAAGHANTTASSP